MRCCFAVVMLACFSHSSFASKRVAHFISLPFIEGTGIYTSVMSLHDAENANTKASAIVNLSLLGTQAAFGMLMAFNLDEKVPNIRAFHRFLAYSTFASGVWLAISNSIDKGTKGTSAQYVSYAYPVCASFPIILFSF